METEALKRLNLAQPAWKPFKRLEQLTTVERIQVARLHEILTCQKQMAMGAIKANDQRLISQKREQICVVHSVA